MSTNSNQDQEIDLGKIVKTMNKVINYISFSIFNFLIFIRKNIILIGFLFVFGIVAGFLIDKNNNVFYSRIIVSPNFGSTEYMYSKVELLNAKVKEKNLKYLEGIGIVNPENIISIEVTPIVDIYSLINNNTRIATNAQNTQNFEMMKLLAESSDINKVIKDEITSRNYPYHSIKIVTNGLITNKNVLEPILKFLNNNSYFNQVKNTLLETSKIKIQKNKEIISQIDALLNEFMASSDGNMKNDKLVYYNENTQLNDIILSKSRFLEEIASQEIFQINSNKTIKDTAVIINNIDKKGVNGKFKFILPILFIFGFIVFSMLKKFYEVQKKKLNQ